MEEISNMLNISVAQAISLGGIAFVATQMLKKKFKLKNSSIVHSISTIIAIWVYISFRLNNNATKEINSLVLVVLVANGVHIGYKKYIKGVNSDGK